MLKQLWISGILMAFGVFGLKTGLGLGMQIYNRSSSLRLKTVFILGTSFLYSALFLGLYLLVSHYNLVDHLDAFTNFLTYGLVVHLAAAAGLFIWGLKLILSPSRTVDHRTLLGNLLLIIPCPVCIAVILLNLTLAYSLFQWSYLVTTLTLFAVFFGLTIVTSLLIYLFRDFIKEPNSWLGLAMCLIALYFLLTVIIAPIYPEIKAAFTMASSNNQVAQVRTDHALIMGGVILALISAGFLKKHFAKGGLK